MTPEVLAPPDSFVFFTSSESSPSSVIFEEIKDYSFLHSGPYLVDAVTKAVKCDVPGIAEYLNCRRLRYTGNDISIMQYKVLRSATQSTDGASYGVNDEADRVPILTHRGITE